MKWHRIYGITLRYLFLFRRSIDRLSDAFYWPTIDLLLWGLTSSYFASKLPPNSNILLIILSGLVFWIIVWRGQYEITVNLLEDLWNKNLVNIFVSPLTFWEWLMSFIILGIVKAALSFSFAALLAFFLYKVHVIAYGLYALPFVLLLFMTGWAVGFFISGVILRYGSQIQTLAWSAIYMLSPFSAIYYPVSILPTWAQTVAKFVPTSYVFEGMREVIRTGRIDLTTLLPCLVLNLVYLALSLWYLRKSFNVVLAKGLVKVY